VLWNLGYYATLTKQLNERRFHVTMVVLNVIACLLQISAQCCYSIYYSSDPNSRNLEYDRIGNLLYSLFYATISLVLAIFTLKYIGLAERVYAITHQRQITKGFERRTRVILAIMLLIIVLQILWANWMLWNTTTETSGHAVVIAYSIFQSTPIYVLIYLQISALNKLRDQSEHTTAISRVNIIMTLVAFFLIATSELVTNLVFLLV
jgi:hypothetical protein